MSLEEQQQTPNDRDYYSDVNEYVGVVSPSKRAIQYIDVAPKPFTIQIPLWEYFERVKRLRIDRWQRDFADRLQEAAFNRHHKRFWELYHAQAQLGKTSMLSQCYPAWVLGHDPLHRIALAMYNMKRSQTHSQVVIDIMNGPIHKDIFPDPKGLLVAETSEFDGGKSRKIVSKSGWRTNARRELNDGQLSFNPVGLQSGLVGSGFDTLIIDDPYREAKEAFSETVRETMANMWEYTMKTRASLYSNIFGMFHRYHVQDLAGYLLDSGEFGYIRYASIADGDYVHDETGQIFPDPLGRKEGEYISARFDEKYYRGKRENTRVWMSMFQGRPSSEEGEFFNVGKITNISTTQATERTQEAITIVRSHDQAASEEEGAAFSVGAKMSIRADRRVTIHHVWRKRLDPSGRMLKMKSTAIDDGANVIVTVPNDPGAAGDIVVFHVQQELADYTVVARSTSGTKEDRARNFAGALNSGLVEFVIDDDLPEDDRWNKVCKNELRDFPLSEYKDVVDAMSDGYNELYERFRKGLVIKNYFPQRQVTSYTSFANKFPFHIEDPATKEQKLIFRIPKRWTVYAGIKIQAEASKPTSAIITARAPMISNLEEHLFVIAEYKVLDPDVQKLFDWLKFTLEAYCEEPKAATVWLHPDSEQYLPLIRQKIDQQIVLFEGDEFAGISELDWYMLPYGEAHPFNEMEQASRLMLLVPEPFISTAFGKDGKPAAIGLYATRQEMTTWGYTDKGVPSGVGQVLDCLRMVTHMFRTRPDAKTMHERYLEKLVDIGVQPIQPGEVISPERQMEMQSAAEIANERLQKEAGYIDEEEQHDQEEALY